MATRTKTKSTATKTSTTKKVDHQARVTTNHRVIRNWVEARGGTPATVKGTRRKGDPAGILRIDFPGYSGGETLKAISWDDFFAKFDEADVAFLYQNHTADGSESRFSKFVSLETAQERVAEGHAEVDDGSGGRPDSKSAGRRTARTSSTKSADHKTRATTSHRAIKRWTEARGGTPATVKGTRRKSDPAGILRIDFPGYSGGDTLKAISWDDFFTKFDEEKLVFLYQNHTADGSESRFCKFVDMKSTD